MNTFSELQNKHNELITKQLGNRNEDITGQVSAYIDNVIEAGSEISDPREREQLRSYIRYWESYIYEKTGKYPPHREMAPGSIFEIATSPPHEPTTKTLGNSRTVFSPLGVLLILVILFLISLAVINKRFIPFFFQSQTPTQTQRPSMTPSLTKSPSPMRSLTPTITSTPSPLPTETPSSTPTLAVVGILVEITSPVNSQNILPDAIIYGKYKNLLTGWSIHVLEQRLSQGSIYYPLESSFIVPSGTSSGDWSIQGYFGSGLEIQKKETYILTPVLVVDNASREILKGATQTGLPSIPEGVIPFQQLITINRPACTAIVGERLVFSSFYASEVNNEIVSTSLDGSDLQRITHSRDLNEMSLSVSPDGNRIVYVGQRSATTNPYYSVEIINNQGSELVVIAQEEGVIYDDPVWSPDGKYIAYAAGITKEGKTSWSLYIYNLHTQTSQIVESLQSIRYPSWIGAHILVYTAQIPKTGSLGFRQFDVEVPGSDQMFYDTPMEELQSAISPNGMMLTYLGVGTDGSREIYMVKLPKDNPIQLTKSESFNWYPAWAPDERGVYYVNYLTGSSTIWQVDIDGANNHQVTFGYDTKPFVGLIKFYIPIQ